MSIKSGQDQVAGANQGLQAAVTGLGKHYGNEIAKQIPVQAQEQKNTQAKLTEQAITAQKEALTKAAAEYLQENNLNVPEGKIKATIEKHSVFKGNAADIEESLISLGTAAHEDNKNRNDAPQAIKRGLSIVLRSTIKQLVLQTAASSTSTNAYQSNRQTQTRKPEQGPLITPNKTTTENKAKLGPRNSEPKTELPVNTVLLPFGKPSIYLSPAEKVNEDLTKAIANNASNGPRVAQHNLDTPPRNSADDLMAQRRAINQSIHGSHYQEESCLATQFVGTLVGGAEKLASNTVELTKMGGGLLLDGLLDKDYMNVISPQMRQEAHVRNQERGTAILNAFKNIPNAPTLFKQHVEEGLHQASENIAAGNNFTAGKQLGNVGVEVVQVAATVLGAANLVTKGVQSGTQAVNTLVTNTKKFITENEFRSPITIKYDSGTLNSIGPLGVPIDTFSLRNPVVRRKIGYTDPTIKPDATWTAKDILSEAGLKHPAPLLSHEIEIITQWMFERKSILEKFESLKGIAINDKMFDLLQKVKNNIKDHMTPDDLAAILKEKRGVNIFKQNGHLFEHFNMEWRGAKKSMENAIKEARNLTEADNFVLGNKIGEISIMWDRYEKLMEQAKCLAITPPSNP